MKKPTFYPEEYPPRQRAENNTIKPIGLPSPGNVTIGSDRYKFNVLVALEATSISVLIALSSNMLQSPSVLL